MNLKVHNAMYKQVKSVLMFPKAVTPISLQKTSVVTKIRKRITQLKSRFAPHRLYRSRKPSCVYPVLQIDLRPVCPELPACSSQNFFSANLQQMAFSQSRKIAGAKSQVLRYHAKKRRTAGCLFEPGPQQSYTSLCMPPMKHVVSHVR